jgi:putative transcriptional regulator
MGTAAGNGSERAHWADGGDRADRDGGGDRADGSDRDHRGDGDPGEHGHRVACHLDGLLAARGLTLRELSERVGVTVVNLSVLKNDRARAIRFSTLTALCDALECQPGDLFSVRTDA